jgi:hypothetical protein
VGSSRDPRCPTCPPLPRPVGFRNDRGGGFTNGLSEAGGWEEFRDVLPNRASNSATLSINAEIT